MSRPVVLAIGGFDPLGGGGIHSDYRALAQADVQCVTVLTAITAQNHVRVNHVTPVSGAMIREQLVAISEEYTINAVKIGLLVSLEQVTLLKQWIQTIRQSRSDELPVVLDPVAVASCGDALSSIGQEWQEHYSQWLRQLWPYVSVMTPNQYEWDVLKNNVQKEQGVGGSEVPLMIGDQQCVIVTGGDKTGSIVATDQVFYGNIPWDEGKLTNNQNNHHLLLGKRINKNKVRGTGCFFASTIAAQLAKGELIKDAITYAKLCMGACIESAQKQGDVFFMPHQRPTFKSCHLPTIEFPTNTSSTDLSVTLSSDSAAINGLPSTAIPVIKSPLKFKTSSQLKGLYPIVPDLLWLKRMLDARVSIVQLRLKGYDYSQLSVLIAEAVELAKGFNTQLIINDHWELAIEHGADGVHLGQEDLLHADLEKIHAAGLVLGISSRGYHDVVCGLAVQPSYLALGHVFPTTTKTLLSPPQGVERLREYQTFTGNIPTVAIGGIDLSNCEQVLSTGVTSIAVVSAITEADDWQAVTCQLQLACLRCGQVTESC